MSISCTRCGEKLDELLYQVTYNVNYDKCRGKTCPDCGKVRKLGIVKIVSTDNTRFYSSCIKCKRTTHHWIDEICRKCFLERERKKGCVCIYDKDYNEKKGHHDNVNYYCPLCDEVHSRVGYCEKCFEKEKKIKQYNENKGNKPIFFQVVLPTAAISLVVGIFLGWLFFKKLRKKRKTIKLKSEN